MTQQNQHGTFLRFSTEAFPAKERLSAWHETYARNILRVEPLPLLDEPYHSELKLCALPTLGICYGTTSAATYHRTRALTTTDDFLFVLVEEGHAAARQRSREVALECGDAVLLSGADVGSTKHSASSRFISVVMPRDLVASMVPDPTELLVHRIPGSNEAVRLLSGYLRSLETTELDLSPDVAGIASTHVAVLVAATLGAARDDKALALRRGVRAARLQAIKDDIAMNYASPALSADDVGKRNGISARYVRSLFEGEETTFTEYMVKVRLDRAYKLIASDPFSMRKIAAIAAEVGFSDVAHFNRVFRSRFDKTPSDVRVDEARRKGLQS